MKGENERERERHGRLRALGSKVGGKLLTEPKAESVYMEGWYFIFRRLFQQRDFLFFLFFPVTNQATESKGCYPIGDIINIRNVCQDFRELSSGRY